MNLIKIAIQIGGKFSEFYDIKHYKKQSIEQIIIQQYALNNKKITINEEK